MSNFYARRVRVVGVAAAVLTAWIVGGACAKKEAAKRTVASGSVAAADTHKAQVGRPINDACFHFDGSEYWCPEEREKDSLRIHPMLASGTAIDSGTITFTTAQGTHTIKFRPNKMVDAIFLTPRGAKLLEHHYRHAGTEADMEKATRLEKFIAKVEGKSKGN